MQEKVLERQRMGRIGSGDAASILGFNPFKPAGKLWLEKTGRIPEDDLSDREEVYFGNVLEGVVAKEFTRRTGMKVRRVNKTLYHPDHPWMTVHIDRDIVNSPYHLECKTTNAWSYGGDEWGDHGTDQVPVWHIVQAQHGMAVKGSKKVFLAVLVGGQRFGIYEIERDDALIETIIEAEADFWHKVQNNIEIPLDYWHPSAMDTIKAKHPDIGGTVTLDEIASALQARRLEIASAKGPMEREDKALKAQLMDMMGSSEVAYLPGGGGLKRSLVKKKATEATEFITMRYSKKLSPES